MRQLLFSIELLELRNGGNFASAGSSKAKTPNPHRARAASRFTSLVFTFYVLRFTFHVFLFPTLFSD
jgi:hypothetical protein